MKVFVIDQALCNGCYGCQIACKDEHCGNDWPGYQKPQPDLGHFWCKVLQTDHGQVPKVRVEYKPYFCMQCDDPRCAVSDAVRKRRDGLVTIDPERAKGQRAIMEACPYGAVYWNDELDIPQKCDGCAHLVDAGEIPHCVDLCATGALRFGEEEEFADILGDCTQILPDEACRPRVYYLHDPKLFIGGQVYDGSVEEIIEGATITLTKPDGSTVETRSDHFGDFWFKGLEPGSYIVRIAAEGYAGTSLPVALHKSRNIGDFDLHRV